MRTASQPKYYAEAKAEVLRKYPDIQPDELEDEIQEVLAEWAASDAEYYREGRGPEELDSVANCDDWGTGEGRFHGRI